MTQNTLTPKLKKLKPIIVKIFKKNGVLQAGIFGSYARGEQTRRSDIDILVKINRKLSLFDFVGIQQELEDSLKKKVDLVEYTKSTRYSNYNPCFYIYKDTNDSHNYLVPLVYDA